MGMIADFCVVGFGCLRGGFGSGRGRRVYLDGCVGGLSDRLALLTGEFEVRCGVYILGRSLLTLTLCVRSFCCMDYQEECIPFLNIQYIPRVMTQRYCIHCIRIEENIIIRYSTCTRIGYDDTVYTA